MLSIPTSSSTSATPFKAATTGRRRRSGARFLRFGIAIAIRFTSRPAITISGRPLLASIYEQQTRHPAFYGFDYQNAHFTVLDNSQAPDLSLDLSHEQTQFLARDLERKSRSRSQIRLLSQTFLAHPGEIREQLFPVSSTHRQVWRTICGQRPWTSVRSCRTGWRYLSGSA